MRWIWAWLVAGMMVGCVACSDDSSSSSPEHVVTLAEVSSPIVEVAGSVWVLVGDAAIEFDAATRERRREVDLGGDVTRLTEFRPEYRLRVGDYRVLFDLEGDSVVVRRVLHRSKAYER